MSASETDPPRVLAFDQVARRLGVTLDKLRARYRRDPELRRLVVVVGRTLVVEVENVERIGERVRLRMRDVATA